MESLKPIDYLTSIYGGNGPINLLRVLTYHRVDEPDAKPLLNPRLISAGPAAFAAQMDFLAKNYRVVSMPEVLDSIEKGKNLPQKSVLITFDDACCDFGEIAWPIMKRYRLPATVFVATAYPGHPERMFWWDRLYQAIRLTKKQTLEIAPFGKLPLQAKDDQAQTIRRIQNHFKTLEHKAALAMIDAVIEQSGVKIRPQKTVLDWDELRKLAKEGVTLGGHTRTHPILTQISPEAAKQEIRGSMQDLQREIGETLPVFAYPNGNGDERIWQILREAGVKAAFSTERGFNNLFNSNPLNLRRANVTPKSSLRIFRLRLMKSVSVLDLWQTHLRAR